MKIENGQRLCGVQIFASENVTFTDEDDFGNRTDAGGEGSWPKN